MTWSEDDLDRLARERFGLPYLYPYQRLAIAGILDAFGEEDDRGEIGRARRIVILPTGAGKSLCFQLPALMLPGPSLVVYPLLALMADQERRLAQAGIACVTLRGGVGAEERQEREKALRGGKARLILANPESLAVPANASALKDAGISHIVVDEAHCVAEWGESFRPAYLALGEAIATLGVTLVTAFTATASPAVLGRLSRLLFGEAEVATLVADPDRPNIRYAVLPTLSPMRDCERVAREGERPLLVFVSSRAQAAIVAERLSERLGDGGIRFYHAGLERDEKKALESWFRASKDGVLVSTCAYGLGVDKPDIRTVLHFEAPPSVEAFLQESGRAGRDGKPASSLILRREGDAEARSREGEAPGAAARRTAFMAWLGRDEGCRRRGLMALLGSEGPSCSGCDLCDGDARLEAEGRGALARLVRADPRRFDRRGALAALMYGGKAGPPSWGELRDWREEDAGAALSAALRLGEARELRARPFRGRMAPLNPGGLSFFG